MRVRNEILAVGFAASVALFSSCKKEAAQTPVPTPTPVAVVDTGVTQQYKLKDTALQIARDLYLWYGQIPATFDPQTYDDPNQIMTAIRPFSTEAGYTEPVDRWSFAMKKTEWDDLSRGSIQQTFSGEKDLGMNVFFRAEGDLRVRHVEKESPAGVAGVRRGWRITKINGSSDITTNNATTIIDAVYENSTSNFTFRKPDGTSVDLTLNASSYIDHPVVLDSVYTVGSKKAGYLVFNSFLGDTAQIYNDFSRVFTRFSREGVNEVIIDLRYNGGGYVAVQEKLANYLVSPAINGQVMMSEKFNDKHANYNTTNRFSKLGSLNVSRVFFIVSSNTASASELLINTLKPYMDVKLVGPSKTHGKPVGYFPVPVGEWYVFPVSFRTVNKNGEGNYFSGMPITNQAGDGIDKDWGNRTETALAYILAGFTNGVFRSNATVNADPVIESINTRLSQREFRGTIDTRGIR